MKIAPSVAAEPTADANVSRPARNALSAAEPNGPSARVPGALAARMAAAAGAGMLVAGAGACAAPPPDPHLPLFLPLPAGTRALLKPPSERVVAGHRLSLVNNT